MRVAVTGSSGLIGSSLRGRLTAAGHEFVPVVRRDAAPGEISWDPAAGRIDAAAFEGIDAVVNLAGAGIGDKRWNDERKAVIVDSRVDGTRLLAETLAALDRPPKVLLSGSAVGFYGDRGDEMLTEQSAPGGDFLAGLCVAWEAATRPAEEAGIRVCHLRTGIVQSTDGGALAKSLPLFKIGLGGRFGDGAQYWPWISIDDQVRAIEFLLTAEVSGPVNLAGPTPATNAEYTKALGRALHRPAVVPVPMFGPSLLLGRELAEALLLTSARVVPSALTDAGFSFRHPTIEACFAGLLGDDEHTG